MSSRSQSSLSKGARRAAVVVAGTAMALTVGASSASAAPCHHHHRGHHHHQHYYLGRGISRIGQNTRVSPHTWERRVGTIRRGEVVSIVCKVRSQNVDGNNRWYLLKGHNAHGAYSWASARYIANIGPAPSWCR